MAKVVSLLTWLIGKCLAVKGFAISSIVFEIVSKVSGRRQYMIFFRTEWMANKEMFDKRNEGKVIAI